MGNSEQSHYDVAVVGARAGGGALALLLARMGHQVVVLDRARMPSDTLSTHSIARSGVVQLHRWGLLDEVLATGAPAIHQVMFHAGGESLTRGSRTGRGSISWSPRGATCSTRSSPGRRRTRVRRCASA